MRARLVFRLPRGDCLCVGRSGGKPSCNGGGRDGERQMTRTEALIVAILAELEARRAEVDADDGLSTVGVIVRMDQRTGLPGLVIWRPESQRQLQPRRSCA